MFVVWEKLPSASHSAGSAERVVKTELVVGVRYCMHSGEKDCASTRVRNYNTTI